VENFQRHLEVAKAFSPSAPIDDKSLFAGRIQQITAILTAVAQKGQHAIIYGERGVGKTSLANVIHDFVSAQGGDRVRVAKVNGDASVTFPKLWRNVFRQLPIPRMEASAGFKDSKKSTIVRLDTGIDETCGPEDVRFLLEQFIGLTVVIIDEVDRIRDQDTKSKLADTIKTLSDHVVNAKIILVGVADSVEQIVAEHRSVERALVQVRLPRMSDIEVYETIDKALKSVDMSCVLSVKRQIARLSQGLPHYAHLIGQNAALTAVHAERDYVSGDDVQVAISSALEKAQQTIRSAYHKATTSPQENMFPQVLLACALVHRDDMGYFSPGDLRGPMSDIMGRRIQIPQFARHLKDFCKPSRGAVLTKTGPARRQRFRFSDPLLEPFVVMQGISKGLITTEMITEESPESVVDAHAGDNLAESQLNR
jgi:Cdc6-like AAA superfamily ATPase